MSTAETVPSEVLIVVHVDSGWEELLPAIERVTRPGDHLYFLVATPTEQRTSASHADPSALAASRLAALLVRARGDGHAADGEVGETFVLDSVVDVLARRRVDTIAVVTPPLGLAGALHLDLAHRAERAFRLPSTHVVLPGAGWSGGLDLSIGAGLDAARERAARAPAAPPNSEGGTIPAPGTGGRPLRMSRRATLALGTIIALLVMSLAIALPWGFHETDVANARLLVRETAPRATYTVKVGAQTAAGDLNEFEAYYPATIQAHPGDALTFHNATETVAHTVTFGVAPDRANEPVLTAPVLSVVAPCASTGALTPASAACPGTPAAPPNGRTAPLPAFDGQAFYNSGVLAPGKDFTLQLSAHLKPGVYHYYCLLHNGQQGTIVVKPTGEATQLQRSVDAAAQRQLVRDLRTLGALQPPTSPPLSIRAGVAGPDVSLNQFFPANVQVHAGQTVTWDDTTPTPHALAFDESVPAATAIFSRPTAPSGSDYAGGPFVTGAIGALPYPRTSFSLRFTRPGTYAYVCSLHVGMAGTVTVVP